MHSSADVIYFVYNKWRFMKIGFRNRNFFGVRNFLNLRIVTKNHNREIGLLTKSISKPHCRATAMPTAWKLRLVDIKRIKSNLNINMSHLGK